MESPVSLGYSCCRVNMEVTGAACVSCACVWLIDRGVMAESGGIVTDRSAATRVYGVTAATGTRAAAGVVSWRGFGVVEGNCTYMTTSGVTAAHRSLGFDTCPRDALFLVLV